MYIRMIIIFGATLYTSRVVLEKLGVVDYGLYSVVYGTIGMLSFLNGTLSAGTSRFITFALGENNKQKLVTTFSTMLVSHLLLVGLILLLSETIGLWYINNVLVVPPERVDAARMIFQISIYTTAITIFQVPFTAEIMAHERMNVYAYLGIFEAMAKLLVVYLLIKASCDKLILYSLLNAVVTTFIMLFFLIYSKKHFEEVRLKLQLNKAIFVSIMKFSGWNIVANISNTLLTSGVILLLNLFFAPVLIAAQAIGAQISEAMMQFINNVRVAVNPQIIKLYADAQYAESRKLTLQSARYIFDLLLLIGLPCIVIMEKLLDIWLVEVPDYAVIFAQLFVIQSIMDNFNYAFYLPMTAANKISKNAIIAIALSVFQFILLYFMFKAGFFAVWARFLGLIITIVFSLLIKPYILYKDIDYSLKELVDCILPCLKVLFVAGGISLLVYVYMNTDTLLNASLAAFISMVSVIVASYLFAEKNTRRMIVSKVMSKIKVR